MTSTEKAVARANSRRAGILAIAWLALFMVGRLMLERSDLPTWARLAFALAPTPIFVGFLVAYVRGVRAMDELEQKIHTEALALAFWLAVLLLTTLALMQRAVGLKFEDWSYMHVWVYLPVFYFGAIAFVGARYRSTEGDQ